MDISKAIAAMKQKPEFAQNVGMLLVHNGVVRAWSRQSRDQVEYLEVSPDYKKVEEIRQEFLQRQGIFLDRIKGEAISKKEIVTA
jgi:molybdopterin synthase catalytic subunit